MLTTPPRFFAFFLSVLLVTAGQGAFAQGTAAVVVLDAATRASIRAQNQANWAAARVANKAIVSSAQAAGNVSGVRDLLKANVSSTMAANKAARRAALGRSSSSSSIRSAQLQRFPLKSTRQTRRTTLREG